jgi:azurin
MNVRWAMTLPILLLASGAGWADECRVVVEGNDLMQYQERQLAVPASCAEVEITLKHVGSLAAKVMGHNWVLAKSADVVAIANAGLAAGFDHNYQPPGDKRIIAATPIVGGGESITIKFSTAALQPGGDYTFFCSSPGHWSMMKGKFLFGERSDQRTAKNAQ